MLISKFSEIDKDSVEAYEDKLSLKLPNQFRSFILKYNGGETPNTSFKISKESSDVKAFYGLGNVKYSLDKVSPQEINGKRYLPIALDSFGNEVVIDVKDGSISFLNHENGKVVSLADDFVSFIKACESAPISKGAVKSVEEREKDLIAKGRGSIITDALRDMWRVEIAKYSNIDLEEVVL